MLHFIGSSSGRPLSLSASTTCQANRPTTDIHPRARLSPRDIQIDTRWKEMWSVECGALQWPAGMQCTAPHATPRRLSVCVCLDGWMDGWMDGFGPPLAHSPLRRGWLAPLHGASVSRDRLDGASVCALHWHHPDIHRGLDTQEGGRPTLISLTHADNPAIQHPSIRHAYLDPLSHHIARHSGGVSR